MARNASVQCTLTFHNLYYKFHVIHVTKSTNLLYYTTKIAGHKKIMNIVGVLDDITLCRITSHFLDRLNKVMVIETIF